MSFELTKKVNIVSTLFSIENSLLPKISDIIKTFLKINHVVLIEAQSMRSRKV